MLHMFIKAKEGGNSLFVDGFHVANQVQLLFMIGSVLCKAAFLESIMEHLLRANLFSLVDHRWEL